MEKYIPELYIVVHSIVISFFVLGGGQYVDGTTDTTRTFHFGEPTSFQRSAYTRVLLGSIDLARATFPKGTPDTRLDYLARSHLLQAGLNYRHGTGHGIGAYGFIHESPIQVIISSLLPPPTNSILICLI